MNLFHKYGGSEFWSDFLNVFYSRITASELLSHHFEGKDIENIKVMLIGLLEVTLVSQGGYPKEDIYQRHKNMGIKSEELDEWLSIYSTTIEEMGVSDKDKETLIKLIEEYRPSIVSQESNN